jgi:hypothetical protein
MSDVPAPVAPAVSEPPAPPAGTGAPAVPAPPADGRVAAPPAASPESPGIRQLREQYEGLKTKYEPWERLGVPPEDVARQLPIVQRMHHEALQLGTRLGYDAAEVNDVFGRDPAQVLAFLRQQAQQRESQPLTRADMQQSLERQVQEGLQPIIQREDMRMNREAEFRFDSEFDRLYKDNFKDPLPDKAKQALYEMVGQLVGEDEAAIRHLKFEGQVSDIGKHFNAAKQRLLDIFAEWSTSERKRLGQESSPTTHAPAAAKSRLDAKLSTGQSVRELFNI